MSNFQVQTRRSGGCAGWGDLTKLLCGFDNKNRDIWLVPINLCVDIGDSIVINSSLTIPITSASTPVFFAEPTVNGFTLSHKTGMLRIQTVVTVNTVSFVDGDTAAVTDLTRIIQTSDITNFKFIACNENNDICYVSGFDILANYIQEASCAIPFCVTGCMASTVFPTVHIYATNATTTSQVNVDTFLDRKGTVVANIVRAGVVQYMNIAGTVVVDSSVPSTLITPPATDLATARWEQQQIDDLNAFFAAAQYGGSTLASQGWFAQIDTLAVNTSGNLTVLAPNDPGPHPRIARIIITHPRNVAWTIHFDDPVYDSTSSNLRTTIYCNNAWYFTTRIATTAPPYDVNGPLIISDPYDIVALNGVEYSFIYTGDDPNSIVRNVNTDAVNSPGQPLGAGVDITGGNKV